MNRLYPGRVNPDCQPGGYWNGVEWYAEIGGYCAPEPLHDPINKVRGEECNSGPDGQNQDKQRPDNRFHVCTTFLKIKF